MNVDGVYVVGLGVAVGTYVEEIVVGAAKMWKRKSVHHFPQ